MNCNYNFTRHSHWITIQTSPVAGLPIPLSAAHLYFPISCLLISVNGPVTALLSESLVHVMYGAGLPSAAHFSVMFPPSVTVWFPEISMMLGGTAKPNVLAI